MTGTAGWSAYLGEFHEQRAGITEDLLAGATDDCGRTPYTWLSEAVPAGATVLDLACGSAPTAALLPGRRYLGVDTSIAELRLARARGLPVVQADAARLPVADAAVDAVVSSLALQLVPLGPALAEVRRVLRPGGTVVATVPAARPLPARDAARWGRLLLALRRSRLRYPNDRALRRPADPVSAAGLTLLADEARGFALPVGSARVADRVVDALYLPGVAPHRVAAARRVARGWVGGRVTVPVRRLVLQG